MTRRGRKQESWLLSYSDIMTNLMAFMVLLLSFSKIDRTRFDALSEHMTGRQVNTLDKLEKQLRQYIQQNQLSQSVTLELKDDGLHVEFLGSVLFDEGDARLYPDRVESITGLFEFFVKMDEKYQLDLEGHTDDVPLRGGVYQNNWILSSARGVSLLNFLHDMGIPLERMSISGYADTKPKIPVKNLSGKDLEEARRQNRRVVIRIYQ